VHTEVDDEFVRMSCGLALLRVLYDPPMRWEKHQIAGSTLTAHDDRERAIAHLKGVLPLDAHGAAGYTTHRVLARFGLKEMLSVGYRCKAAD